MKKIVKIDEVPHIKGVDCIWDKDFYLSSAEYLGLIEWLCPFCFSNLNMKNDELVCFNGCHLPEHSTM